MKTYEKPRLIALSISGNNMLCSTCPTDVIGSNGDQGIQRIFRDLYGISELTEQHFASGESCSESIPVSIEKYCKFTAADSETAIVVVNS